LYTATQSEMNRPKIVTLNKVEPNMLPELIDALQDQPGIVGFLVALPDVPFELKQKIADVENPAAVKYLASNIKTPPEILLKLATHHSTEIARTVNYNKSAPQTARYIYSIRATFSEDWRHHDEGKNPPGFDSTEEKGVWKSLASDRREYVRTWVARSKATPSQILSELKNDKNEEILKWVFLNNNSNMAVKNVAAQHLSSNAKQLITKLSSSEDREIREAVAHSNDTSIDILKKLCTDREENVRKAVAENSHVTSELLAILGNDSSHSVLAVVAKHPKTPTEVLNKLLNTSVSLYKIPEVASENLRQREQKK